MNSPFSQKQDIIDEAELLGPVGRSHLRLRFEGPFEVRTVTWNATLLTLNAIDGGKEKHNFIEIGEERGDLVSLTVGLNVPCIDRPTVRKAMMMIRRYKRLRRGRHEYGPPA